MDNKDEFMTCFEKSYFETSDKDEALRVIEKLKAAKTGQVFILRGHGDTLVMLKAEVHDSILGNSLEFISHDEDFIGED